jgi:recombination protein RecT
MANDTRKPAPAASLAPAGSHPATQLQPKGPPSPIATFRDLLEKMRPQFRMALPRHIDLDRMLRVFVTTVQRTPKLLECSQPSLFGALIQCAQLGLEPDGLLGHAYLIPFENKKARRVECQLIIGYKGLLKLARQSGLVANVSARIVHEKDAFDYEYGLNERLVHKPYMVKDEKDSPGLPIFAYAIFWLKDGGHHFEVMGFQEIEAIRTRSPSGKSPAWMEHWDEMAKKTALRRASKMSPASVDDKVSAAIALDERAEAGISQADLPELPAMEAPSALEPTPETDGRRMSLGGRRHNEATSDASPPSTVDVPKAEEEPRDRGDEPTAEEMSEKAAGVAPSREPGSDDDDLPPWMKK